VPLTFQGSPGLVWTLKQNGAEVFGQVNGQNPPFNWTGTFTATVQTDGTVHVTEIAYQDSSSHSYLQVLMATGRAAIDATGFSGTLDGEY
jgi:hypothetical protein